MPLTTERGASRPHSSFGFSPSVDHTPEGEAFDLDDFEEELKRLSAANETLLSEIHAEQEADSACEPALAAPVGDLEEIALLRREISGLKARIHELESQVNARPADETWEERQREYEMLLEEKSEVIRVLHQKIHDMQESKATDSDAPVSRVVGQAEEIMRLKRELEEQRAQMDQDEQDMMTQLRQMEMTMAKERAEMARQRQEMQRLQADFTRDVEMSNRDPALRERLQSLRRPESGKSFATLPNPNAPAASANTPAPTQKSSGFFRRMFG